MIPVLVGAGTRSLPVAVTGMCWDCGIEWTSTALAHCASCHESFSADSAFDRHRNRRRYVCRSPASVGLVYDGTRSWWRYPGNRPTGL